MSQPFDRHDEALEREKAAHIAEASQRRKNGEEVEPFLTRYFQHVAAEDVLPWPPVELYEVAWGHREFAQLRPPGAPKVRVVTFGSDELAGRPSHTLVQIVTDDMPFLVDSVTQELSRSNIAIQLVVHPQFVVRRGLDGTLREVLGTLDAHEAPADTIVESWMHFEVAPQPHDGAEQALRENVLRILRDVRDVVEDWPRMRAIVDSVGTALTLDSAANIPIPAAELKETAEFLHWLARDHFTFLGYREYRLFDDPASGEPALGVVAGTGLGILRADKPKPRLLSTMSPDVRVKVRDPQLLLVTKANSRATVHRPVYLDYIGVKIFDDTGTVVGERRFLGLFTSGAYVSSVQSIPLLRHKVAAVIERSGYAPQSHSGKDLLQILEDLPRDEMFQTSPPELYEMAIGVLHLQERRRLRLFMRKDVYGRFVSCLVYLPRERYSTQVRLRMQDILLDALGGSSVDDTLRVAESVLARVHFVVRVDADATVDVDRDALERRLVTATRTWDDDLVDELEAQPGLVEPMVSARYVAAFPEAYKEDFVARTAVADIHELEQVGPDGFTLRMYEPDGAAPDEMRLKVFRVGPAVSLSHVLPLLQSMGVEVTDERPYGIERRAGEPAWIYDFGLRHGVVAQADGSEGSDGLAVLHRRFQDALSAAWRGEAEADGFQALVLRAGLDWRQVVVLRAYAKYLRQAGSRFGQEYVESALVSNAPIARLLIELFEARLDPAFDGDRDAAEAVLIARIEKSLDDVSSLDEDRIVRSYLAFIKATLRTNHWQRVDGAPRPYLSLKFASQQVPDLPQPRPKFEIFVYSPRIEGVHLRFGAVARGGIRYSDRREDFRTEVLGLAKTQTVKNAVIVPIGSKGGFVVKRPPADAGDRDAQQGEVVYCYSTLIRGLLDLTDNLVTTPAGLQTVSPDATVRHDGDDSYLVVAADKGTATFSDIANGIAAEYGYWLGDAFASGGSDGYDHKVMGITARGGWESVKRHFRDIGVNCQTTDFTCAGIGDMSGDVFGNGMLLSRHLRLVAAFDHRHIFIDPRPDAAASFEERARLFELSRSSWADYDVQLISQGGGIWPRTAKAVPVSPEMAAALDIPEVPLSPSELMRAILRAPVDLLWNGGIGTYVKAQSETAADVGDRANDAIRVDGRDLRCKIVGEGGNLGFTQLGRIEFALAGGHINTDAIDNSAGVDTSDHEVNIKILLDVAARSGRLIAAERAPLLASMTDEIAGLVLRDNYAQNLALACSQSQALSNLHVDAAYVEWLDKTGHLSRALEHLPDAEGFIERQAAGLGLTRPELAVLLAYAKITTAHEIVASDLADDIFAQQALVEYFPSGLRERFAVAMAQHPLLREIIATQLANQLVNYSGATFAWRLGTETTAAPSEIVRAHTAARQVFDTDAVWSQIEAHDDDLPSAVQISLFIGVQQILESGSRWFLSNRRPPIDVPDAVSQLEPGVRLVLAGLADSLRGAQAELLDVQRQRFIDQGVDPTLAGRTVALGLGLDALSIVENAHRSRADLDEVARVHFALAETLGVAKLSSLVAALASDSRWHTLARAAAREDLLAAHTELTADVLATTSVAGADERIAQWQSANASAITRAGAIVADIVGNDVAGLDGVGGERVDLATLSVALREIRALVRAVALPSR